MSATGKTQPESGDGKATFLSSLSSQVCYYAILWAVKIISYIPFKALYALSDALFYPLYHIARYRRKIVRKNLVESFPDKGTGEIVRIEKGFYHFFVDTILESCKLMSITPQEMMRRLKFTNVELVNDKLAAGKSVAIFMGHYGNWEWVSTMPLWLYPGAVPAQIYRKLRNGPAERVIMKLRGQMGAVSVEMRDTVRFMARGASGGRPHIIGFIADQTPRKMEVKHFFHFLNRSVPALTGTEKTAKHFGYEVVFLSVRRVRRGYYECEFSTLHDNPRAVPDFELTSLYYQRLEQEIKREPELYLWTHKRFKYAIVDSAQTTDASTS